MFKIYSPLLKVFIDLRYEWSILSGSNFQTLAKPAYDWLDKKERAVSCGRIHVTNIKISRTSIVCPRFDLYS